MTFYSMIENMQVFKHFSEKEKKDFAEMKSFLMEFGEGDEIIKEGDIYTSLYLLINGTVSITKTGYNMAISKLQPGAVFGEMSFLTKKPRFSNVIADGHVMVMKMDDQFFKEVSPEIKDKIKDYLIELLIKRLDTMNASLNNLSRFTG